MADLPNVTKDADTSPLSPFPFTASAVAAQRVELLSRYRWGSAYRRSRGHGCPHNRTDHRAKSSNPAPGVRWDGKSWALESQRGERGQRRAKDPQWWLAVVSACGAPSV